MKLSLDTLQITGFRTWDSLTFPFEEGLTLICGENGAGKSSIRLGAQYALTGSVPKLPKSKLIKSDNTTTFSVALSMTDEDGKPIAIRRASSQTISVDGVDMSVRENTYTKRFKMASTYTFLSPDMAAFADVPPFKRRELLTDIIPEVSFFRDICAQKVGDYLQNIFLKKSNINSTIYSLDGIIAEQERSLATAQRAYEAEVARIEALKKVVEAQLLYTATEVRGFITRIDELNEHKKKLQDFAVKMKKWLDQASLQNHQSLNLQNTKAALERDLTRADVTIESYEGEVEGTQRLCPSCQKDLVCASCGTNVVSTIEEVRARKKALDNARADRLRIEGELVRVEDSLKKFGAVPTEEISSASVQYNKALSDIQMRTSETESLREKVNHYNAVKKNLDEVTKVSTSAQTASTLLDDIEDMKQTLQRTKERLVRKRKTVETMDKLEHKLRQAEHIFKVVLPEIYFNKFMGRLTAYSNYLLSHISDMAVNIYAEGKDVHFTVDGKEYEQLSSGERQRVKTATTLAFSLMTDASDTLFIDEVFDAFLDAKGIDALAVLFCSVMPKFYKKIIIISNQVQLMTALEPDRIVEVAQKNQTTSMVVSAGKDWKGKSRWWADQ